MEVDFSPRRLVLHRIPVATLHEQKTDILELSVQKNSTILTKLDDGRSAKSCSANAKNRNDRKGLQTPADPATRGDIIPERIKDGLGTLEPVRARRLWPINRHSCPRARLEFGSVDRDVLPPVQLGWRSRTTGRARRLFG